MEVIQCLSWKWNSQEVNLHSYFTSRSLIPISHFLKEISAWTSHQHFKVIYIFKAKLALLYQHSCPLEFLIRKGDITILAIHFPLHLMSHLSLNLSCLPWVYNSAQSLIPTSATKPWFIFLILWTIVFFVTMFPCLLLPLFNNKIF